MTPIRQQTYDEIQRLRREAEALREGVVTPALAQRAGELERDANRLEQQLRSDGG